SDEGCIDFVVIAFEEKLIAVPFTLTRIDFTRKVVFLNAEREFILRAPTFARDRFPDLSVQSEFGRRVNNFFRKARVVEVRRHGLLIAGRPKRGLRSAVNPRRSLPIAGRPKSAPPRIVRPPKTAKLPTIASLRMTGSLRVNGT